MGPTPISGKQLISHLLLLYCDSSDGPVELIKPLSGLVLGTKISGLRVLSSVELVLMRSIE